MHFTTTPLEQPSEGVLEGSYLFPHRWTDPGAVTVTSEGEPVGAGLMRIHTLLHADEQTGPLLMLATIAPGCRIPPDIVKKGAHNHRTDTFRMPVMPVAHPQLKDSATWLSAGEFLLMDANKVYVEAISEQGVTLFGVYADRRGYPHGYDQRYPYNQRVKEWPRAVAAMFGPDHSWPAHESDDDPVDVLATTFADAPRRRPAAITGSFHDDGTWSKLSDGSTVAAALMGDPASGCLTLMTNNAPGALEAPASRANTDTVRLVLSGSVRVGERTYVAGEFRATDAGVLEGPVVHGPDGSSQVLVCADRRGWLPAAADGGDVVQQCPRLGEVAAVLEPHLRELVTTG